MFFFNPKKNGQKGMSFFLCGGCFKRFLCCTPKIGEDEPILTHIFQMGLKPPTSFVFGGWDSWFLRNIFSQMMVYPAV